MGNDMKPHEIIVAMVEDGVESPSQMIMNCISLLEGNTEALTYILSSCLDELTTNELKELLLVKYGFEC